MPLPLRLTPLDPRYPSRLRSLPRPPPSVTVRGDPMEALRVVAVVGSRDANAPAARFAADLASTLVRAGAVVVSGGAQGIDAAAHRGALEAGGRTWVVAGTGPDRCFPAEHAALFDAIGEGPGAMLWPFDEGYGARSAFLSRNRVLVALADAVVVAQAGERSGALHAAGCARSLGKPLWVVPAAPWMKEFAGSTRLLDEGARPLTSVAKLVASLGLTPASTAGSGSIEVAHTDDIARGSPPPLMSTAGTLRPLTEDESRVLAATSSVAKHVDAIADEAHSSAHVTAFALLTLALENVVVEGPASFFRRRDAPNQ